VVGRWVGSRDGARGQLAYYREGTLRRERAYRITATLGAVALGGGLLGATRCWSGGERIADSVQQNLLLAMGLLPLLAGIREAYSYKKADKELIKQFRFMSRLFASCRQRLDRAGDEQQVRQLLRALGCACLEEHAEWILLHRDAPLAARAVRLSAAHGVSCGDRPGTAPDVGEVGSALSRLHQLQPCRRRGRRLAAPQARRLAGAARMRDGRIPRCRKAGAGVPRPRGTGQRRRARPQIQAAMADPRR
jgi:hypothetical protein